MAVTIVECCLYIQAAGKSGNRGASGLVRIGAAMLAAQFAVEAMVLVVVVVVVVAVAVVPVEVAVE